MNWDAIGAVGEVIGAIAVVASLVYLARQIRQNSVLLEQSAAGARASASVVSAGHGANAFRQIALDPELTRIWVKGISAPGELREEELHRFDQLLIAQLIEIDANYSLMRSGVLDAEIWAIWDRILDRWLPHPRFRRAWESGFLQEFMTASLRAHLQGKLAAPSGST